MCMCVYIHKEHIMVPVGEKKDVWGVFFGHIINQMNTI